MLFDWRQLTASQEPDIQIYLPEKSYRSSVPSPCGGFWRLSPPNKAASPPKL